MTTMGTGAMVTATRMRYRSSRPGILRRNQLAVSVPSIDVTETAPLQTRTELLKPLYGPARIISFLNVQRRGHGFTGVHFGRYGPAAAKLYQAYDEEIIEFAMREASRVAKHPWGFQLIEKFCREEAARIDAQRQRQGRSGYHQGTR